jgi:fluoride exporter
VKLVLAIAAGGALGAVARYLFAGQVSRLFGHQFPWGILIVNVLGSFAMGVLVETMARGWNAGPEARAFLAVGVLGGFTTFSSFSLDAALLLQRGDLAPAAGYVLGSVVLSVLGLFAGLAVVRALA